MKFEKIYEDSQLPIIKTEYSAGLDFYSREDIDIKPQETVVVGLGVRSVFDEAEFKDGNNKFFTTGQSARLCDQFDQSNWYQLY